MHGSTASGSVVSEKITIDISKTSSMQSYTEHARLCMNNVGGLEAAPLPLRQTAWSASRGHGPIVGRRLCMAQAAVRFRLAPKTPVPNHCFSFSGVLVSSPTLKGLYCRPVGGGLGRLQGSIPSSDFRPTDSFFTPLPLTLDEEFLHNPKIRRPAPSAELREGLSFHLANGLSSTI